MKNISLSIVSLIGAMGFILAGATPVAASPANPQKGTNNPQVVAFYEQGNHTVIQPDNSISYGQLGADLVLEAGEDKTFQQWYVGNDGKKVHTVWRNVGSDTSCPENWLLVENPHQPPQGDTWGYHFPDNANYCVKSN